MIVNIEGIEFNVVGTTTAPIEKMQESATLLFNRIRNKSTDTPRIVEWFEVNNKEIFARIKNKTNAYIGGRL